MKDIIVIGASTAGSYFARRMAERGYSVLVIEKDTPENLSPEYDVFHMGKAEMEKFGLPEVREGDGIFCFTFDEHYTYGPYGKNGKYGSEQIVGMHKRGYCLKLNEWAKEAGAEIVYGASFESCAYAGGIISGVRYSKDGETFEEECRLCVDCSGKSAVVRRSLPDGYGVEKFALTDDDIFFVTLRYIKFREPLKEKWLRSHAWVFYKMWLAPSDDIADGILGIGSSKSFAVGDRFYELFRKNVPMPEYDVVKTEYGTTPYNRAIYSFVGDSFLCMGDAACITKPMNGEGCTAALVLEDIAVDIADMTLRNGRPCTRAMLWPVNKQYYSGQGRDFELMRALLIKAANHSVDANEYLFEKDVIFSEKIVGAGDFSFTPKEIAKLLGCTAAGVAKGKIRPSEIAGILKGGFNGLSLYVLYSMYPSVPAGFDKWKRKADKLWKRAGKMSDCTDYDISR